MIPVSSQGNPMKSGLKITSTPETISEGIASA
jgi:hypothetical protein